MAVVLTLRNGDRMRYLLGCGEGAGSAYLRYALMLTRSLRSTLILHSVIVGHIFCKDCIDEVTTTTHPSGRNRCPSCRAEYVGSPIKLFIQEPERHLPQARPRTWAEATIPLPFFAERQIRDLQEGLATSRSVLETTQRQLELLLAENLELLSQNRLLTTERDTARQAREQPVEAGRKTETNVFFGAVFGQSTTVRQNLSSPAAGALMRPSQTSFGGQYQREGQITHTDSAIRSAVSTSLEALWVPV